MGSGFFLIPFLFIFFSHPCMACGLWLNLFGIIVFLISQPYPTKFQWNLSYPLKYAYSTCTAIFRLTYYVTAYFTQQDKDSITHNSTIILSLNFNGRRLGILLLYFYEKVLFWWVMLSFSQFEFKWSVYVIGALNQLHVINTWSLLLFPMIYSYHGSEKCEKLVMLPQIIWLYACIMK